MKLLTQIANSYGTDKGTAKYPHHGFSEIYDDFLNYKRFDIKKVLEIGIDDGFSLRMWRDFFPNATVYGMDVQARQLFSEHRIVTRLGNQAIDNDLNNLIYDVGGDFDLIIDDGGHVPTHQQITLGYLFKFLKNKGIYIVEDLHTSFMKDWLSPLGLCEDSPETAYNVLKKMEVSGELITPFINEDDIKYIKNNLKNIKIFDLNEDKKHITSILEKL